MTVRGVFYRLLPLGVIPKTENGVATVGDWLLDLRRDGELPYEWIVDYTRRIIVRRTWESFANRMLEANDNAALHIWTPDLAKGYPMIATEKETMTGVFDEVTWPYAVPLVPVRGNAGESYVFQVARYIINWDMPVTIYYFGDYD